MANWDHLSNIGTHPILSADPAERSPHVVAAAEREIARFAAILDREIGLRGRSVTVTIGRNVGNDPLSPSGWEDFRALVRTTLANLLCPDFAAEYDGKGSWDGIAEDSTTFVASGITSTCSADVLRSELADIAYRYGQDAIALTIGATELVARRS